MSGTPSSARGSEPDRDGPDRTSQNGIGPLSALDPRQLECFIAVAEELNFGRAAVRLHMTQPPLTRRIHRLEHAVRVDLFHRTATGVELTEAGSELLGRAYRIVELSRRALESVALADAGELGALRVGYNDPVIVAGVPKLLDEFVHRYPRVDVRFHYVLKREQMEYLRDRSLHVVFSREYPETPGVIARTVITEDLYLVYRPDVFTIAAADPTPADLRGLPLVLNPGERGGFVDELFRRCREAGFVPQVAADAEDVVATLAYAALGTAIGIVPDSATTVHARGVTFRRLSGMSPLEMNCIYGARDRRRTLELFVTYLEDRFQIAAPTVCQPGLAE